MREKWRRRSSRKNAQHPAIGAFARSCRNRTSEKRVALRRRRKSEENDIMMTQVPANYLSDSILYLCTLLADRPRLIDQYIDYFGEAPRYVPGRRVPCEMRSASRAAG